MFTLAVILVITSLAKIIIDLSTPGYFAILSLFLDNVLYLIILSIILRVTLLKKRGKREQLKDKLTVLEKSINKVND